MDQDFLEIIRIATQKDQNDRLKFLVEKVVTTHAAQLSNFINKLLSEDISAQVQ
jgi:hypothetical protein